MWAVYTWSTDGTGYSAKRGLLTVIFLSHIVSFFARLLCLCLYHTPFVNPVFIPVTSYVMMYVISSGVNIGNHACNL